MYVILVYVWSQNEFISFRVPTHPMHPRKSWVLPLDFPSPGKSVSSWKLTLKVLESEDLG